MTPKMKTTLELKTIPKLKTASKMKKTAKMKKAPKMKMYKGSHLHWKCAKKWKCSITSYILGANHCQLPSPVLWPLTSATWNKTTKNSKSMLCKPW